MLRFSKRATSAVLAFPMLATVAVAACSGDDNQGVSTGSVDVRLPADSAPFSAIGYVIANGTESFQGNAHPDDPSMPSFRVDVVAGPDYLVTVSALPVTPSTFVCSGSAGPITVVGGSTVTVQVPLACASSAPKDASADRAVADRGPTADRGSTAERSSSEGSGGDAATARDAGATDADGSSVAEDAPPDANAPEVTPDVSEEATDDGALNEVSDAGQDTDDAVVDEDASPD